jgi:hypothetical protein
MDSHGGFNTVSITKDIMDVTFFDAKGILLCVNINDINVYDCIGKQLYTTKISKTR